MRHHRFAPVSATALRANLISNFMKRINCTALSLLALVVTAVVLAGCGKDEIVPEQSQLDAMKKQRGAMPAGNNPGGAPPANK